MAIEHLEVSAEIGEFMTLKLALRCFSAVDIIYSDEKSGRVEIHYGLTNFIFLGCAPLLNQFNTNVNNLNFQFKKVSDYVEVERRLKDKKGCQVTSEAIVEVSITEIDNANSTIYNIIELLSLATRNFVSPIYEDYFYNGELIRTILNPILTMDYNRADGLINSNIPNPCNLQIFLESTYNKYQEFKEPLELNGIIHLYILSRYAIFSESKFLLAIVSLESLSSHFEEYLKGKGEPIKSSLMKKTKKTLSNFFENKEIKITTDELEELTRSIAYSNPTFLDKLMPLLATFHVKYSPKDLELINLRNKIVHLGKFPEKFNSRIIKPHEEEVRLIYLLDRILLSILDYKNKPFLNISNSYKEEILR